MVARSAKEESDVQKDAVQALAVSKIVKHFKGNSRGQLAMFCGTGKTRTAIKAIRRMKARVVVVCVPTLGLASQWLKDFSEHGDKRAVLAVCSRLHNETPEEHGIVGATTDKAAVRAFARRDGKLLIISTYQSYDVIQAAWNRARLEPIDLLIADEAHNTAGRNSKHMGLCLHDKGAKVEKRLFMTATRRLYRGEKQEYNCMDDTEVYGDVVYELTIREAIDRGILADYEVHVINVYKDLTPEDLREINKKGFESEMLARFVAQNLMSEKRVKVFSFHNRVADATKFSEQVAEHGQWSQVLTGEQRVQDREQVLQEFRNEARCSLIASVNVLGEGIDAPTVDVVVFADRMAEPGAIQQRMGRGTRMAAGKRKLRIILPICVSPKMSDTEVLQEAEESQHKDALHFIRALALCDPKFYRQVAELDRRRSGKVEKGDSGNDHEEDQMLWFDGVSPQFFDARLLPKTPWPSNESAMKEIKDALSSYYSKHGSSPVDSGVKNYKDTPNGFNSWSSTRAFVERIVGLGWKELLLDHIGIAGRERSRGDDFVSMVVNDIKRFYLENGCVPKQVTKHGCSVARSWMTVAASLRLRSMSLSQLVYSTLGVKSRASRCNDSQVRIGILRDDVIMFHCRNKRFPKGIDKALDAPSEFKTWYLAQNWVSRNTTFSWKEFVERSVNGQIN